MTEVEQFVSTRVETAYSPTDKSGYQVVHHSAGLKPADVRFLHARAQQCHPDLELEVERLQHLKLPGDRAAFVHTRLVTADPGISDATRDSVIFSHGVVMSEADFLREFDGNPFRVLDANWTGWPLTGPKEMVEKFGRQVLEIPALSWEGAGAREYGRPEGWPDDEWDKLLRLAADAGPRVTARKAIQLRGDSIDVADLLRAVLDKVPPSARALCTFDTAASPTSAKSVLHNTGEYWAIGTGGAVAPNIPTLVDVNKRRVTGDIPEDRASRLVARWDADAQGDPARTVHRADVRVLAHAVEFGEELPAEFAPSRPAWVEVEAAFPEELRADLGRRVRAALGRTAEPLLRYISRAATPESGPWWLVPECWACDLAAWAAAWVASEQPQLGRGCRRRLRAVAETGGHRPLGFWMEALGWVATPRWFRRGRRLRARLDEMSSAEFRHALRLLGPVPFQVFVHEKHADDLVTALSAAVISEEEFVATVQAVVAVAGVECLDLAAGKVRWLSVTAVRQLRAALDQFETGDGAFVRAVEERLAPTAPTGSFRFATA